MKILFPLVVWLLLPSHLSAKSPLEAHPQATERVKVAATLAKANFPFETPMIRVYKFAHRLELWADGKKIKSYRVGLSNKGLADKRVSGDHLTPEGRYYICSRSSQSAYHLFLGLSYPNEDAAHRGIKSELLSKSEHQAILKSLREKSCPKWNTRLGGTVGIHGHGSNSDWTWGCVALEDYEVDEIWVSCPNGTPVQINP